MDDLDSIANAFANHFKLELGFAQELVNLNYNSLHLRGELTDEKRKNLITVILKDVHELEQPNVSTDDWVDIHYTKINLGYIFYRFSSKDEETRIPTQQYTPIAG